MQKIEIKDKRFELVDQAKLNSDLVIRANISFWQDSWRRLKKNKVSMTALFILLIIISGILIIPIASPKDYITTDITKMNLRPSKEFIWGTDGMGRDLFTRIWVGARVSLLIAIAATTVDIIVGCIYGGIAAYVGGIVDEIMMRIVEILNSIPELILILLILVVLGSGPIQLMIALCITGWTGMARIIRGQVLQLRENEYVLAAEALGASKIRVIVKHLLPNIIGIIVLNIASYIPMNITFETYLSFLGIGITSPNFSLGSLLLAGQQVMRMHPYQLLFPCLILCLLILSCNILGDGLRDALDPKMRK